MYPNTLEGLRNACLGINVLLPKKNLWEEGSISVFNYTDNFFGKCFCINMFSPI